MADRGEPVCVINGSSVLWLSDPTVGSDIDSSLMGLDWVAGVFLSNQKSPWRPRKISPRSLMSSKEISAARGLGRVPAKYVSLPDWGRSRPLFSPHLISDIASARVLGRWDLAGFFFFIG